jgi:NAD(P)-dependent dehydrogenase (short-subunit alcohol dehydrogenase family)
MEQNLKNLFSVKGKVALVTGGSRGIGEMIAGGLLSHGVKVYISSRKAEACDATAKRLSETFGGECISLPANMAELDGINSLVELLSAKESKLDILINNAGVSWGDPLADFPEIGWDKVMDTNVKGIFFLIQKLLPLIKTSASFEDPARVINIGSIDGIVTSSFNNFSYAASKAAVHHLTSVLAAHLVKEHITVNAIAPGTFPSWMLEMGIGTASKTDGNNVDWEAVGKHNPSGRVGTIEDITGLVVFLCSRAGSYIVGETIVCDGGSVVS